MGGRKLKACEPEILGRVKNRGALQLVHSSPPGVPDGGSHARPGTAPTGYHYGQTRGVRGGGGAVFEKFLGDEIA